MSFYKRTVTLPTMYEHVKPDARVIDFASVRLDDIERELEELKLEKKMWADIKKRFEDAACADCAGSGEVGYYPDGMEDGRKFKRCDTCKGTGKPK